MLLTTWLTASTSGRLKDASAFAGTASEGPGSAATSASRRDGVAERSMRGPSTGAPMDAAPNEDAGVASDAGVARGEAATCRKLGARSAVADDALGSAGAPAEAWVDVMPSVAAIIGRPCTDDANSMAVDAPPGATADIANGWPVA